MNIYRWLYGTDPPVIVLYDVFSALSSHPFSSNKVKVECGKHIINGINLTHHLQQEEKSGKRKIARCTILKLVDGGQTKPRKLGNLLLGESRLQMTQIHPSLHHSHINVFSWKKSQSIIIYKYITDT